MHEKEYTIGQMADVTGKDMKEIESILRKRRDRTWCKRDIKYRKGV